MRRRTAALALAISLAAAGSAVAQTAERLPAAARVEIRQVMTTK